MDLEEAPLRGHGDGLTLQLDDEGRWSDFVGGQGRRFSVPTGA